MSEAKIESGIPTTADGSSSTLAMLAGCITRCARCADSAARETPIFDDLGIGLYWLEPGKPMSLYHHEAGQEDFLVLRGECILIIEGQERSLKEWDFVHCPPRTPHTIVASGAEPALVLAVGARKEKGSARYPVEVAAVRRSAGVPDASTSATDVYASFGEPCPESTPEIFSL